eukprot:4169266-Pyramimonas_sp.AAC.1
MAAGRSSGYRGYYKVRKTYLLPEDGIEEISMLNCGTSLHTGIRDQSPEPGPQNGEGPSHGGPTRGLLEDRPSTWI